MRAFPGVEQDPSYHGANYGIAGAPAYGSGAADRDLSGHLLHITASRAVLADLDEKKEALENRVHLLRSGSLDLDLLDERARHVLNVGHDDEIIILPDAEYAPVKLP